MKQFLDHPRVQEQLEVLMNSNEVLEDHSIDPRKILSHPIVSNQFHDPDAIISNPLGKPSPVCSDHALVIGESSTSIIGFTNPNDPIRLNSSAEKHKEPIIFLQYQFSLITSMPSQGKVYESANGFVGIRSVMESFISGCRIHRGFIDLWSAFLNDLEKYKGHTTSSRFFKPCSLTV
ncbi:unnamed protein product [Lactuca saligna]|uniref:Uncharacterized protein n=1 Tax=Lactuca saligna TaxID=75948 RepID=A0AA35YXM5_LACSI|nr:unnamed protein product [Lactuca saligna]